MANIIKNEKLNNCFKGLKSCLKTVKNSDYEFVSYDQQQQQPKTNELKHFRFFSRRLRIIFLPHSFFLIIRKYVSLFLLFFSGPAAAGAGRA